MKENEQKEFEKYYDIVNAVKECIEKNENENLSELISHREGFDKFVAKISSKEEFRSAVDFMEESFEKRNTNKLRKSLRTSIKRKIIKRYMMVTASIAAAVITISFLLSNPDKYIETKESVVLGVYVPTLMLDDSIVVLSSDNKKLVATDYSRENKDEKVHKVIQQRLIIPFGQTYTVILEDGTEVMLSANSELSYPSSFSENMREVTLKGEAYFNVTKSQKPFIVYAEDSYIKVYGTSFNVNTKIKNEIKTVLIEGKVGAGAEGIEEQIIYPNQLITLNTKTKTSFVENVEVSDYLGWKEGYFKCIDDKIIVLIGEIAAWHNIEFRYDKEMLAEFKINVSILKELPLEEVLRYLEDVTKLKFIKTGIKTYDIEKL